MTPQEGPGIDVRTLPPMVEPNVPPGRRIRVFGSPVIHQLGWAHPESPIAWTRCRIRFVRFTWPKGEPRPRLPRCAACA